jgi:hypothetical protein
MICIILTLTTSFTRCFALVMWRHNLKDVKEAVELAAAFLHGIQVEQAKHDFPKT